jgi:hypothetical protein
MVRRLAPVCAADETLLAKLSLKFEIPISRVKDVMLSSWLVIGEKLAALKVMVHEQLFDVLH